MNDIGTISTDRHSTAPSKHPLGTTTTCSCSRGSSSRGPPLCPVPPRWRDPLPVISTFLYHLFLHQRCLPQAVPTEALSATWTCLSCCFSSSHPSEVTRLLCPSSAHCRSRCYDGKGPASRQARGAFGRRANFPMPSLTVVPCVSPPLHWPNTKCLQGEFKPRCFLVGHPRSFSFTCEALYILCAL